VTREWDGPTLAELRRRSRELELPEPLRPAPLDPDAPCDNPVLRAAADYLARTAEVGGERRARLLVEVAGVMSERAELVYLLRRDCGEVAAMGLVVRGGELRRAAARHPARTRDWIVPPPGADLAGSWVLLKHPDAVARSVGGWRGIEVVEEVRASDDVVCTWGAATCGALSDSQERVPDPRPPGPISALTEAWGWALTSYAAWGACPTGPRLVLVGLSAGGGIGTEAMLAADRLGSRGLDRPEVRDLLLRDYRLLRDLDLGGRAWASAASLADAGLWPRDAPPGRRGFASCSRTPEVHDLREAARARRLKEAAAWAAVDVP
jgi:hypothetical protein